MFRTITEDFEDWLKGRKPSYELFVEYHKSLMKDILTDDSGVHGDRMQGSQKMYTDKIRQANLKSLDKKVKEYMIRMTEERKMNLSQRFDYVKRFPKGMKYV